MEENQKWEGADKAAERTRRAPLRTRCRDLCGAAVCVAASLLFLGVCSAGFVWISELQSRIVHLEQRQDAQISAWMRSAEQVEPAILGRLDHVLEEVSAAASNSSLFAQGLMTSTLNRSFYPILLYTQGFKV